MTAVLTTAMVYCLSD